MSDHDSHSDSTESLSSSDESILSVSLEPEEEFKEEPVVYDKDELIYPSEVFNKKSLKDSIILNQNINALMSVIQSESSARNLVLGIARARRINTWNVTISIFSVYLLGVEVQISASKKGSDKEAETENGVVVAD